MKRCNYCGKSFPPNGLRVTEKVDGKWKKLNMCNECAKKLKEGKLDKPLEEEKEIEIELFADNVEELVKTAESLMEFLTGGSLPQPALHYMDDKGPCKGCGMTLNDFVKNGKFGCADCYKHFEDELLPILMVHQNAHDHHVGKVPKNWKAKQYEDPEEKRKLLLLRKAKAIELEKYEEAARIVEELKSLDSSSNP